MSKNNKPIEEPIPAGSNGNSEPIPSTPEAPKDKEIFIATTNISTGDKRYLAGEEVKPEDFDNFERLLEIGAVRVESPQ